MLLTTEQLLQPRYKVIGLWPYCNLSIGDILEVHDINLAKQNIFSIGNKMVLNEDGMNQYPHLFKPIQWWEHRSLEEMSGIKHLKKEYPNKNNDDDIVIVVSHWKDDNNEKCLGVSKNYGNNVSIYYKNYIPITPEEYTAIHKQ